MFSFKGAAATNQNIWTILSLKKWRRRMRWESSAMNETGTLKKAVIIDLLATRRYLDK